MACIFDLFNNNLLQNSYKLSLRSLKIKIEDLCIKAFIVSIADKLMLNLDFVFSLINWYFKTS
ncbi:hypothetical protein ABIC74_003979 [Mucilaginibacter rubeus]